MVSEQIQAAIRLHWQAQIYYAINLILLAVSPTAAAVWILINILTSAWLIFRLYKLKNSPFLYLEEVRRLCEEKK